MRQIDAQNGQGHVVGRMATGRQRVPPIPENGRQICPCSGAKNEPDGVEGVGADRGSGFRVLEDPELSPEWRTRRDGSAAALDALARRYLQPA